SKNHLIYATNDELDDDNKEEKFDEDNKYEEFDKDKEFDENKESDKDDKSNNRVGKWPECFVIVKKSNTLYG
ncbi:25571_t:CDS:1, partial [Gigaspora margarita]